MKLPLGWCTWLLLARPLVDSPEEESRRLLHEGHSNEKCESFSYEPEWLHELATVNWQPICYEAELGQRE